MISIITMPGSNTEPIVKQLEQQEIPYQMIASGEEIQQTHVLVLPGGLSYIQMMEQLQQLDFTKRLQNWSRIGLPLFAVGTGAKVLLRSYEAGSYYQGLNLISGKVVEENRLDLEQSYWIQLDQPHPLLQGCREEQVILSDLEVGILGNREDSLGVLQAYPNISLILSRARTMGFLADWSANHSLVQQLFQNFLSYYHPDRKK
ncbi:type 1 glutamine amidotransferase family protein [Risungbinella massiliensis]|uniref:hypothetical protein n=1 Tax=Risungbinella massiliensis TaxID=1329796 RepID=UPI0005CC4963|nr:hypothetical protein [Risungbinella massiliensis]